VRIFLDAAILSGHSYDVLTTGPRLAQDRCGSFASARLLATPPGQEWTRQFTVTASDGYSSIDASGSLVQASSRAATNYSGYGLTKCAAALGRRGVLRAMIDNRNSAQPIRVAMRGDDRRTSCASRLRQALSTSHLDKWQVRR
jgi:hypothetical protein